MKIDLDTLRKAVNQKLINEQLAIGFHKPIDIYQGSHTSFDDMDHHHDEDFMSDMGMDDYDNDYEIYEDEDENHTKGGDELEMIKQNLFQLSVYAAKLHDMMEEDRKAHV